MDADLFLRTLHWGLEGEAQRFLQAPAFEPVGIVGEALPEYGLPTYETFAGAFGAIDAEAVVIGGPEAERAARVIEAMAADLHVLVEAPLAADPEEVGRCVFIAQNRGVRLMIADRSAYTPAPSESVEPEIARRFVQWVLEGDEPPTSARRVLAEQTGRDTQNTSG